MSRNRALLLGAGALALLCALGGAYLLFSLSAELREERTARGREASEHAATQAKHETDLAEAGRLRMDLEATLAEERRKGDSLSGEVSNLSGTVATLEKRVNTDPELLQKYSKVYFLNENYAPQKLEEIPAEFLFMPERELSVHAQASPFLEDMLKDAKEDGVDLLVVSAYRSFGTQASLKSSYRVTYGAGANAFSADQGYSEHQLGTTLDFTTKETGASFSGFSTTDAYDWLIENAYRYGFILSYPKNNGYYQYEPWHWRFVGKDLARRLYKEEERFYNLDQREIDEYLGTLFE